MFTPNSISQSNPYENMLKQEEGPNRDREQGIIGKGGIKMDSKGLAKSIAAPHIPGRPASLAGPTSTGKTHEIQN